ncbi:hypothetical protein Dimus_015142 [Dionaea muscipula]
MDDWRPVLRRYARRKGTPVSDEARMLSSRSLWTIYQRDMESNDVRRVFKNFGIVTDVFSPRKKSVRVLDLDLCDTTREVAAWMAVEKSDGLWIEDKRLKVNMAASGRMRRPTGPHARDNRVRRKRHGSMERSDKRGSRNPNATLEDEGPSLPVVTRDTSGIEGLQRSFIVEKRYVGGRD